MTAYLGLGSSVGDRQAHLRAALHRLETFGPDLRVVAVSPIYQTPHLGLKPGDATRYPPHLNLAAKIETDLSPDALLERIHAVEGGRRTAAHRTLGATHDRHRYSALRRHGSADAGSDPAAIPASRSGLSSLFLWPILRPISDCRTDAVWKVCGRAHRSVPRASKGWKMDYLYEAVDPSGRTVLGKIEATDEVEVRRKLTQMGYRPQTVAVAQNAAASAVAPRQTGMGSVAVAPNAVRAGMQTGAQTACALQRHHAGRERRETERAHDRADAEPHLHTFPVQLSGQPRQPERFQAGRRLDEGSGVLFSAVGAPHQERHDDLRRPRQSGGAHAQQESGADGPRNGGRRAQRAADLRRHGALSAHLSRPYRRHGARRGDRRLSGDRSGRDRPQFRTEHRPLQRDVAPETDGLAGDLSAAGHHPFDAVHLRQHGLRRRTCGSI